MPWTAGLQCRIRRDGESGVRRPYSSVADRCRDGNRRGGCGRRWGRGCCRQRRGARRRRAVSRQTAASPHNTADSPRCRDRIIGSRLRKVVPASVCQSTIQVGQARDEAGIVRKRPLLSRLVHGPQLYPELRITATTGSVFAPKWHMRCSESAHSSATRCRI